MTIVLADDGWMPRAATSSEPSSMPPGPQADRHLLEPQRPYDPAR
jgi:hypothetical protein